MSTGYSTQPPTYPASGPQPGGYSAGVGVPRRSSWSMRDARIRSKLALILFVPLVAVLALATLRLVDVGTRARDAGRVEQLTRLSANVSDITQYVHAERMAAATYLASATPDAGPYNAAIRETDTRIQTYTTKERAVSGPPAAVRSQLNSIHDNLRGLDAIRRSIVDRTGVAVSAAVQRYDDVIEALVGYGEVLSRSAGDGTVADDLRALTAYSHAIEATSDQEATAYAAQLAGDLSDQQRTAIIATQARQRETLLDFAQIASPAQRALVDSAVSGATVTAAAQLSTRLSRGERVDPREITTAFGGLVNVMRQAEQSLARRAVDDAVDARRAAARQAAVEAVVLALVLVIALALAFVLARALNRALRRLREGALAVANRDLPDVVTRLRDVRNLGDAAADDIVRQVRDPIQLNTRDEIGQVAQAFNVVHREAVRIAAEQAALRTSVSTMFLNLARRSQSLVDRMIGELDQIERSEEDPKRLAQLFELDHLATRMRRNDENLLVLAGADSSVPRREDALLVDAVRAAQSEVELYNRIEFGTIDTDISIAALAVNDVVRLLAELLDNATRFSPPHTIVVVEGRRIRDYVLIQIEDRGLGMSAEQMDVLNRRLAMPPVVDVGAFRLMGLAVVGRLANRYGIRVELRTNLDGGTVAQVTLPGSIVVLPNRPIDAHVTAGRPPQLDSGTYESETGGLYGGRFAAGAATLAAIAPEPWDATGPPRPSLPPLPSQRRPVPTSPAPAGPGSPAGPGPGSPATAAPGPASTAPAWPGFATPAMPAASSPPSSPSSPPSPTVTPQSPAPPSSPATEEEKSPDRSVRAEANGAIKSPTVAYPTMRPASPDLQVAVGFVTPEGSRIPPRRRPAGQRPGAWGTALAGMPPPPPPPAAERTEERSDAPIFLQMQANWFQGHDTMPEWSMPTAGYAPPPTPGRAGSGPPAGSSGGPAGASGGSPAPGARRVAEPQARDARQAAEPSRDSGPWQAAGPPPPVTPAPAPGSAGWNGRGGASDAERTGGWPPADPETTAARGPARPHGKEDDWRTVADEGWQRAMAAAEPPDAGTTRSGLPKRVPQAQLVPGGVQSGTGNQNRRSPDQVRGLLSAYHRGVQRGRTESSAENAANAPGSKENEP